ncbi:MAG: L-seryl-tRNA(Sec) selenium transferase [Armatimonadota bacterium]
MPSDSRQQLLRRLPAVSEALEHPRVAEWLAGHPRPLVVRALQDAVSSARRAIVECHSDEAAARLPADMDALLPDAEQRLAQLTRPSLCPVINATGIIVHTGLGRSLLADEAVAALERAARSYTNLELDLDTGERGSRHVHLESLLCDLTGAEAALAVNNNAAAVLLTLNSLAEGREVIVSRGQLVEIGGAFRMPDIVEKSGCRLVAVGTTNRTRLADYERAITENTAALMRVHHSNFAILGFTEETPLAAMAQLARERGLLLVDDLGSGALVDLSPHGLGREPLAQESVAAGADIVTFSGDKLLGGPQAGIILGRQDLLARVRKSPLARAVRLEKLIIAALEATLRLYLDPETALTAVPTLACATEPADAVRARARSLLRRLRDVPDEAAEFEIVPAESAVGGGALPGQTIPSWALAVRPWSSPPSDAAARLRTADPPAIARVQDDRLLLDLRTVRPDELPALAAALRAALS